MFSYLKAQVQHITGELLNFIEDVTNFNDASEQQKAELIYRELVQKENELRELLTKEVYIYTKG